MSYIDEYEKAHTLPQLRGVSEKQVEYGRACRFRYLVQSRELYNGMALDADRGRLIAFLKSIKGNVNPRFWINRDSLAKDFPHSAERLRKLDKLNAGSVKTRSERQSKAARIAEAQAATRGVWRPKSSAPASSWKLSISKAAAAKGLL